MMRKTAIVAAMAFVMVFGTVPVFVNAEEEQVLVPIEAPDTPMNVGVYFADNMVFTPQWRIGNLVRIEMMVIDLDTLLLPKDVHKDEIDKYTQAELMITPAKVLNTRMVSVSSIKVQIVSSTGGVVWSAEVSWDLVSYEPIKTSENFGREINQYGHLIYGGQWDTTGEAVGVYTVNVTLGPSYTITYVMGTNKTEAGLETPEHIYDELADEYDDDVYVLYDLGIGWVAEKKAWLELGNILTRGGGGGNSGGNGNGGKKG
jgi:hypothetical protein